MLFYVFYVKMVKFFDFQVTKVADKALKNGLDKYHAEKGAKHFFDWLQQEVKITILDLVNSYPKIAKYSLWFRPCTHHHAEFFMRGSISHQRNKNSLAERSCYINMCKA